MHIYDTKKFYLVEQPFVSIDLFFIFYLVGNIKLANKYTDEFLKIQTNNERMLRNKGHYEVMLATMNHSIENVSFVIIFIELHALV